MQFVLTEEESEIKRTLWVQENKEYLEKQQEKLKQQQLDHELGRTRPTQKVATISVILTAGGHRLFV